MYTLILMSTRKNSVRQYTIKREHILLFSCVFVLLCVAGIGGVNYGLSQQDQRISAEEQLQASTTKKIEEITQAKLTIESELADLNEEMEDIHEMIEHIRQALGILGQGGGENSVAKGFEETVGSDETQQENVSVIGNIADDTHEKQQALTVSLLRQKVMSLYNYVSEHQKQLDEYPSILPIKLQRENGEIYTYWYSSGFGWRMHPLTKKREFHQGLDIKAQEGVPVIAAAAGTIIAVKQSGYLGKTIEIEHMRSQMKTLYAHLQDYAEGLKVGEQVPRGQLIGYVGNTGRSTGAHLHYGIYNERKEQWVNPIKYILDQQPIISP
ncbi:MAG: M23 family metallopeptidase [Candidatus Poribacteria bacterium]|nr:M23 family metallopeptidase [Candidatus Poribacteria bacterium]